MADRCGHRLLHGYVRMQSLPIVEALDQIADQVPLDDPVTVRLEGLRVLVTVTVGPIGGAADGRPAAIITASAESVAPLELKRIHRKLLEKATTMPVKARTLILAAGYKDNTFSRRMVSELVRAGLLIRDLDNRYALPTARPGAA